MIKYQNYDVVFNEIPDMVSLAINITNCQNRCVGCHTSVLRQNIGIELTEEEIDRLIKINSGINCIIFMGEGNDKKLLELAKYIKNHYDIKIAIYSGRDEVEKEYFDIFDYIKIGHYEQKFGSLNDKNTNQRLYQIDSGNVIDITYKFWKILE